MIVSGRISVPPSGPHTIAAPDGIDSIVAHPSAGVWHLSLAAGLQLTMALCLTATGTKPGVSCSVECLSPTSIAVYRTGADGDPEDGDVWVLVKGVAATGVMSQLLRRLGLLPPLLDRLAVQKLRGNHV